MAGTLPAAARGGRAGGSGGGGDARAGGARGGLAVRVGAARGRRPAPLRGALGLAPAADLVHGAVVAAAVDVELAPVALDDDERVAVAAVAGVVDEHAVARAADDLHVLVALDLLGLLALGRRGRLGVGRRRRVLVLGVADGGGMGLREGGATRGARLLRARGLGGGGVRGGGDLGHELGTGSEVSKERTMAPIWRAASGAPA